MMRLMMILDQRHSFRAGISDTSGFSLAEFLVASLVLLLISAAIFDILADTQKSATYQVEAQAALDNSRIALDTLGRHIRQAGNDHHNIGISGISIVSPSQVRITSDLTGSAGAADPDKGDPDGDVLDAGEDVLIRYDAAARTLEMAAGGAAAQTVANNISACSFQYLGPDGAVTADGANVRRIKVSISGASPFPNPTTGHFYAITLSSDIRIGQY